MFLINRDSNFVPPAPAPSGASPVVQRLGNPYTTMVKLIDNQWGPCPLSAQFPMHGGTLVIDFSATAHTDQTVPSGSLAIVGYTIQVDGIPVGAAQTFVSAADLWSYASTTLVVENLGIGDHTVTVVPYGPYTSNDQFNLFNLTVLEF